MVRIIYVMTKHWLVLEAKNESYQRNKSRLSEIGLQGIEIVTALNNLIYVYFTDTR